MSSFAFIVGVIASIVVTLAYVPQVIHTVKLKHMKGISMTWLLALFVGSLLYALYGLLQPSLPNTFSGIAIALMVGILMYHKVKYK